MRHKDYKFKGRHYSVRSVIALGMGAAAAGAYIFTAVYSGLHGGNAGFFAGVLGMICFVAALAGFILAVTSFKERDIYYGISVAGCILNGISLVTYLVSYILGIIS